MSLKFGPWKPQRAPPSKGCNVDLRPRNATHFGLPAPRQRPLLVLDSGYLGYSGGHLGGGGGLGFRVEGLGFRGCWFVLGPWDRNSGARVGRLCRCCLVVFSYGLSYIRRILSKPFLEDVSTSGYILVPESGLCAIKVEFYSTDHSRKERSRMIQLSQPRSDIKTQHKIAQHCEFGKARASSSNPKVFSFN